VLKGPSAQTVFTALAISALVSYFVVEGMIHDNGIRAPGLQLAMNENVPGARVIDAAMPFGSAAPAVAQPVAAAPAPVVASVAAPEPRKLSGTVTAGSLNLRSSPSPRARVLGSYARSTEVVIVGEQGGWLEVQTPDGRTGWMSGKFVERAPAPAAPVQVTAR